MSMPPTTTDEFHFAFAYTGQLGIAALTPTCDYNAAMKSPGHALMPVS
jgi:hypothetical protein